MPMLWNNGEAANGSPAANIERRKVLAAFGILSVPFRFGPGLLLTHCRGRL